MQPVAASAARGSPARQPTRVSFMGLEANATAVVYAIDCSGSMMAIFDGVKNEALASIAELDRQDRFQMLFFSSGVPREIPPRGLSLATGRNKMLAIRLLMDVYPSGQTDPLPTVARAFGVLAKEGAGEEKVIFLVTDSDFPDSEAVVQLCRKLNAKKDVRIFTLLVGNEAEASSTAEKMMKTIASQNGGQYMYFRVE